LPERVVRGLCGFCICFGQCDIDDDEKVTGLPRRNAPVLEAQLAAVCRIRGNRQVDVARGRPYLDSAPKCRLPGGYREIDEHVLALDAIVTMRPELDFQVEIARLAAADARAALPCQANVLALANAFRYAHVEGALLDRRPAIRADLGMLERDRAALAGVGVLEVDQDLRIGVLAARTESASGRPGKATTRAPAPEQAVEEIAEVFRRGAGEFAAVELESFVPVRRRPKILPLLPFCAEPVISRPLFRVSLLTSG